MKATPDGDGLLLDHSLILRTGSGMSESNTHSAFDRADAARRPRRRRPAEGRPAHQGCARPGGRSPTYAGMSWGNRSAPGLDRFGLSTASMEI